MKKLLALLLAMVMIFALAACAGDSTVKDDDDDDKPAGIVQDDDKPAEEKATPVEGEWISKIVINEDVMDMGGMKGELEMVVIARFNDDYTYELTLDEEALKASAEKFIEDITASMVTLIYDQYEQMGLSKEETDATIEQTFGMSVEEYCKTAMEEVSVEDLMSEMDDDLQETGTYRVEGDQLYLLQTAEADDEEEPEEEPYTFKIEGDKLSLSGEDEDFKEMLENLGLTELVFTAK